MVSDEQLIADLQEFAEELGETPTTMQMRTDGPHSVKEYIEKFGSWENALSNAELDMNPYIEYVSEKEKAIRHIQKVADKLLRPPTMEDMEKHAPRSGNYYLSKFSSWDDALTQCGLDDKKRYTEKALISDLVKLAREIDETPRAFQMNKYGEWSHALYINEFGSWEKALRKAGLDLNDKRNESESEPVSKSVLISDLKVFAGEIDGTPSTTKMDMDGPWNSGTYIRHFGSWNKALKEVGLKPVQEYPVEPAWSADVDDYYGESWPEMREKAVQRDDEQCRVCGDDELLNVHHIKPRRCFENPDDSNTLDNLITLCASCHGRFENQWTDTDPDEFEAKARELLSVA